MKGLILSITAGQGHNQTAMVLSEHFNKVGIECKYLDVYKYINPVLSDSVNRLYLMSTKKIPKIYGGVYRMCEKRNIQADIGMHGIGRLTNSVLSRSLIKLIRSEEPDFIICTHIFAALLVTYISSIEYIGAKTIGIVTDFTIHPYWEDSLMDYYITASERLTIQGVKKGFPESKFVPLGIPISTKFCKKLDKQKARKQLGLPDKRTILVMSGSMGFGNVISEISELDKLDLDFQIVSICGNNKKLRNKIDKLKLKKAIFNYGFVDNVDIFMDACDCIITKPGGLTTSEALAKQIPMLINNPIPGQEDRNVEFLLNAGAAMKISSTTPIDEAVYQLFLENNQTKNMKASMKLLAKPNATTDLVEFVQKICDKKFNP